ncbi:MAG: LacI family transcriptional regulator [Betaproteobacteria bacterium]|nr:LacI family transcriptional regulator [Betaproteobacteria bacterium]
MVIASAPGGGTDIVARLLAHKLSESWRQQVVPDNRAGGGGVIATDITAKAAPDGHTLLVQSSGITYGPALYAKLPYDVQRDIAPVSLIASQAFVLTVHAAVAASSVTELIRFAKAKPGQVRFGSGGVSGASHLGGELFRTSAGVDIVHVPYKGTGPAMAALLSGEIHMLIAGVATVLPHAKLGKVRALGVTGAGRISSMPDIPTVAESGLPGYRFDVWYGLFAPGRLSDALGVRINADVDRILREPETRQQFAAAGVEPAGGSVADFRQYVAAEMVKWTKVIREAGIRAD